MGTFGLNWNIMRLSENILYFVWMCLCGCVGVGVGVGVGVQLGKMSGKGDRNRDFIYDSFDDFVDETSKNKRCKGLYLYLGRMLLWFPFDDRLEFSVRAGSWTLCVCISTRHGSFVKNSL